MTARPYSELPEHIRIYAMKHAHLRKHLVLAWDDKCRPLPFELDKQLEHAVGERLHDAHTFPTEVRPRVRAWLVEDEEKARSIASALKDRAQHVARIFSEDGKIYVWDAPLSDAEEWRLHQARALLSAVRSN